MASHRYETNPVSIIVNGFKRSFAHSQQLAVMLIVIPFALSIVNLVGQIFSSTFSASFESAGSITAPVVVIGGVLFLFLLVLQVFVGVLQIGFQSFAMIKISRDEDETFGRSLEIVLTKFWKIIGVNIVVFIHSAPYLVAIGMLGMLNIMFGVISMVSLSVSLPISIILGTILMVLAVRVYMRFAFAPYLLFENNLSISSALEKSRYLTNGRLGEVFGVISISSIVPFVSSLCLASGMATLFNQLVVARQQNAKLPKQHPLNYLVLALVLTVTVLTGLIILAVYFANS